MPTITVNGANPELLSNEHGGSMVCSVVFGFDSPRDPDDFTMQVDDGASLRNAADEVLQFPVGSYPDALTVTADGNDITFAFGGASLVDGVYDFLDNAVMIATLHRLYGDIDGDRTVSETDVAQFEAAINTAAINDDGTPNADFVADFDSNQDGFIDTEDLVQFKNRIDKRLEY